MNRGQLRSVTELTELLYSTFPFFDDEHQNDATKKNLVYAFGYGSGVLSQQQAIAAKPTIETDDAMIDMIIVVKDALLFHQQNLIQNPDHYPWWAQSTNVLKSTLYNPRLASFLQKSSSFLRDPGVYFNVTPKLKYGIVQKDMLCDDLEQWKYLYIAGRLHKPVVEIVVCQNQDGAQIQHAQQQTNLPAALAASLLLDFHQKMKRQPSPLTSTRQVESTPTVEDFTSTTTSTTLASDIYMQIAGLSYAGDPRVGIAEDPQKTRNLVHAPGQLERFDTLYRPYVHKLETAGILSIGSESQWSWDWKNPKAHQYLWSELPKSVRADFDCDNTAHDVKSTWAATGALSNRLAAIVAPAARCQTIKGVFTAGIIKSTKYALRKVSKGLLRKRK